MLNKIYEKHQKNIHHFADHCKKKNRLGQGKRIQAKGTWDQTTILNFGFIHLFVYVISQTKTSIIPVMTTLFSRRKTQNIIQLLLKHVIHNHRHAE